MEILSIGKKIKKIRTDKKLSLSELGGEYVSKAQLSYIENEKVSPSIDLLKYLAERLEVKLEYLLETEEEQVKKLCNLLILELNTNIKLNNIKQSEILYKKISNLCNEYELTKTSAENELLYGTVLYNNKSFNDAMIHIEKSIEYAIKSDAKTILIKAYIKEGNMYASKLLYEVSLQKNRQAYITYCGLGYRDLELEGNILFNISTCYHELGYKDESLQYAEKVCEVDKESMNVKRYAQSLLKYSSTLILKKEYIKSEETLIKANLLLDMEEDKVTRSHIENNLGYIFLEYGKYEVAYQHLIKAKTLKQEMGRNDLPNTLFELYKYYMKVKNEDKAIKELESGIEFSRSRNLNEYIIKGLHLYIDYYVQKELHQKAVEKLTELVELLKETNLDNELMKSYLKLGKIHSLMNNEKEAIKYFSKGYEYIK